MARCAILFVATIVGCHALGPYPDGYNVPLENILLSNSSSGSGQCSDKNLAGLLKCFQTQKAMTSGGSNGGVMQDSLMKTLGILKGAVPEGNELFGQNSCYQDGCGKNGVGDPGNGVFKDAIGDHARMHPGNGTAGCGTGGNESGQCQQPTTFGTGSIPGESYQSHGGGRMESQLSNCNGMQQGRGAWMPPTVSPPGNPAQATAFSSHASSHRMYDDDCSDSNSESSSEAVTRHRRRSCGQRRVVIRCVCTESVGGLNNCECNRDMGLRHVTTT